MGEGRGLGVGRQIGGAAVQTLVQTPVMDTRIDVRARGAVGVDGTTGHGQSGQLGRSGNRHQVRRRRRTSEEVDRLRARALLDDDLAELSDAEREWVWRSLLKGIRVDEACVLALLDLDRLDGAMEAVRARYARRIQAYKARREREVAGGAGVLGGERAVAQV